MGDDIDRQGENEERVLRRQAEKSITHKCSGIECNNRIQGSSVLEKCDECKNKPKEDKHICIDCGCDISHKKLDALRCDECNIVQGRKNALKSYHKKQKANADKLKKPEESKTDRLQEYLDSFDRHNTSDRSILNDIKLVENEKMPPGEIYLINPIGEKIKIKLRKSAIIDLAFEFDDLIFSTYRNGEISLEDIKNFREKLLNLK